MVFGVLYPRAFYYYHQTKTTKCQIFKFEHLVFFNICIYIAALSSLSDNSYLVPVGLESAIRTMSARFVLCIVLYCMFELRSAIVSNIVFVFDVWGLKVRI